MSRGKYAPEFKTKLILKVLRGERELGDIAETMCLSIDEGPHMIAMEDGAATIAAMYTLCVDDGLDTVIEYQELSEHLDGLLRDMYDKMRERYPVPAQGE